MQFLQPANLVDAAVAHGYAESLAAGQCSGVAHFVSQREPPDDRRIGDRLAPFRGVHDEVDALDVEVILTVVDKFLTELQGQLDEKRVTLQVDEAARRWLVERGYDVTMGARPMERVIQENIKKPLAEMVLFGELSRNGGVAHVSYDEAEDCLVVDAEVEEEEVSSV